MNRIFLVRHGLTEWNYHERYQGQLDVPLSVKGRLQIAAARERLRDEAFTVCYTSALSRARLSAEIILEEHFCALRQTADLNEMSYGDWEGLTRTEIIDRYRDDWNRHAVDPIRFPPTNGETRDHVWQRVERVRLAIEREHDGERILIAAHGGTIRAYVAQVLGLGMGEARRLRMDNASITIVESYSDGGVLSVFNDTAHLGLRTPPPVREPAH